MRIGFILLTLLITATAQAKSVSLEWKEIPSAAQYELVFSRNGKPVHKKIVKETHWKGNLNPGLLTYQIRAIDKMDRPGRWSEARALIVSPENPLKIISPEHGKDHLFFSQENLITLEWQPLEGVQKYILEIEAPDQPKQKLTVTESKHTLKDPPAGKYFWNVTPVFELKDKSWEIASAKAESKFEIEIKKLPAPEQIEPKGVQPPPKNAKVTLRWKPVENAKGYFLEVQNKLTHQTLLQFTTDKTAVAMNLQAEGEYEWKVQALATLPPTTPTASSPLVRNIASVHASSLGETSSMDFKLDRSALHVEGFGYIALSTMLAPYSLKIVSPSAGFEGSASSLAMTGRLSGEYWPGGSSFGGAFGMEDTFFTLNGQNFSRLQFEGHAKYRLALSKDRFGWFISPKLGVEYRQYQMLTPVISKGEFLGIANLPLWTAGPSVGVDIRKQFSEKWSLGVKSAYFIPLTLSGAGSGKLGGPAVSRNFGAGAQTMYWLDKRWGLGFGAFYELRSIGYQGGSTAASSSNAAKTLRYSAASSAGGTSSQYEEVYMDAVYFFGSIIFSFGR